MASVILGYEYDIFISYRQKDNKHDGWVTEFVDNLKGELESTFKEEISVNFDINPHDGLLETHDVDASLKEKMKCLIFIPIISRTYCDPKSFAWEHEFKAFVEQASQDEFGLKVKLSNGNVASRILPIQIHDLDADDKKLIETELGGFLRGIEFIYKEPGVNRPLMVNEDHPDNNLNKTFYRNQINKVSNAVKEIIIAIKKYNQKDGDVPKVFIRTKPELLKKLKPKIIIASFVVLVLIMLGYFFFPKIFKSSEPLEKSIAVLPFRNLSNDTTQVYFCDGFMEEILNDLQKIKSFSVRSRTSSDQYRGTRKSITAIGNELKVNYLIEGSVGREGNNLKIWVKLIDSKADKPIWTNNYNKEMKHIFSLQSEIAKEIALELKTELSPEEIGRIEKTHTTNLEAYDAYLKGEFYRKTFTRNSLETAMKYYQIALEKDPEYALAYCGIAYVWNGFSTMGFLSPSEGIPKEYAALMAAQNLDSTLAEVHYELAVYKLREWDWESGESEYQKAIRINPNYAEARANYSHLLNTLARPKEAMEQIELALKLDPYDPQIMGYYGVDLIFVHRYNDAIVASREAIKIDSNCPTGLAALMLSLHITGRYGEALELWKTNYYISYPGFVHAFDKGYAKAGYAGALSLEADTLAAQSKTEYVGPFDLAYLYICSGNKKRALDYLERAFGVHDYGLFYLTLPIFDSLHNEPRFQALCKKMNLPIK